MGWLGRLFGPFNRKPRSLSTTSTRPELRVEQMRRGIEHDRTDRLAQMLNDYRAQDGVMRR
jgi:hypothetical protein